MLKKVLTGTGIVAVLTATFFLGSLALGVGFAQTQPSTASVQTVVQGPNIDSTPVPTVVLSSEIDSTNEAEVEAADTDTDNVENQVEQDGEFDGEF